MAHSQETRNQAFKLYSENWHVTDISSKLGVPLRTVQRWLASADKKDDFPESLTQEISKASLNQQDSIFCELDNLDQSQSNWQTTARLISIEQSYICREIRNRAYKASLRAFDDENWRALQVLSNVIDKALANEHRSWSLEYLDINRATECVIKYRIDLDEHEVAVDK